MSRPIQPLPPRIGPDGKDLFPFIVVAGRERTPYAHWFDAVMAADQMRPGGFFVRVEGFDPSHDTVGLQEDGGLLSCTVCGVLQDTQGAIVPCGLDLTGIDLAKASLVARADAEAGL